MLRLLLMVVVYIIVNTGLTAAMKHHENGSSYDVHPFYIDLSSSVPHMNDLIGRTQLPKKPIYYGIGESAGIDLDVLQDLQTEWLTNFTWYEEQAIMNRYRHYTADIEGLTIHFIHEKSASSTAIPLILNHGWPSSFLEFLPLVDALVQPSTVPSLNATFSAPSTCNSSCDVSFHVVIPSLPGFGFSSPPPNVDFTTEDTARVFNTLMTDVLGYRTYAVSGTDWGSPISYAMYNSYETSVRAAHFSYLPFPILNGTQLAALNISLDQVDSINLQAAENWIESGQGYRVEQGTKPQTIGFALEDNPVGQLAWIGEKMIEWSDPRAGSPPSVLNHAAILRQVSLSYLTQTFTSSAFIYYQNAAAPPPQYVSSHNDAPFLSTVSVDTFQGWTIRLL
ncbi:hypothetical protein ZTR_07477 [Talaromyces verruculosus]|nr:hypothetical protein ZTR_07477 [Talaromyces verruculosus]